MSLQALRETINNLKSLKSNLRKSVIEGIEQNRKKWEDMQRERISEGKNVQEENISYNKPRKSPLNASGAYTRSYSRERSKEGLQTRVVDLKRTGKYQNKIKAKGTGTKVYFESEDEKAKYIEKNYDDVLGFTEEEEEEVFNDIGKKLVETVDKALS